MKAIGFVTGKLVMLLGIGCAVVLASAKDASANRITLPPSINLAIGGQHELGQASPPVPEGDAAITQYVNFILGLSLGGSDQVIIGPHTIQVTRSMNNFGQSPSPATLALRGTGTSINLAPKARMITCLRIMAGPGVVPLKFGMSAI
jgi:hypothetical protein